jgi:hypothetical protein
VYFLYLNFINILLRRQVPSPAPPSPFHLASPTMFSSEDKEPFSPASSTAATAYSPYSPAARHRRSSSAMQQVDTKLNVDVFVR